MPRRINGCGTWYVGSSNRQQYAGTCAFCRRAATLTSYDTTLFVTILFVPLIPVGRKRITEQCKICRRHRVMPLAGWRAARQRMDETAAAYRAAPADPALAAEALGAVLGYRDVTTFTSLAPEIEAGLANHQPTLLLLATAQGMFGDSAAAERLIQKALDVEDTDAAREAMAACLLKRGDADGAAPYLQHVIDDVIPDRVGLLGHLAQVYQSKGEHEKALATFDNCQAVNPAAARDKAFVRLRQASEKRLGSQKPIPLGALAKSEVRSRARKQLAVGVAAGLGVACVVYLSVAVFIGFSHKVYVVNGLARAYSVRLNGTTLALAPYSTTSTRLAEGAIKVQIVDAPPGANSSAMAVVRTPFFERPFSSTVFVINPDETAIIERRTVYYTTHSFEGTDLKPDRSFSGGALLLTFEHVDYPFRGFPKKLTMDSQVARMSRVGLIQAHAGAAISDPGLLMVMAESIGKSAAAHAAGRHVVLEPDRDDFLPYLVALTDPASVAALLRPGLDVRPLRMVWHRTYQQAMSECGQDEQVEHEYAGRLAGEPGNHDLAYLAGRCTQDYQKSVALLRQSVQGDRPCGWAYYTLCAYAMERGDFNEAADWAESGMKTIGDRVEMRYYARQAMLASGRLQRAIELAQSDPGRTLNEQVAAADDEAYASSLGGQWSIAVAAMDRAHQAFGNNQKQADAWRNQEEARLQYAQGRPQSLAVILENSVEANDRFIAYLLKGDLARAEQDLQAGRHRADAELLLYLAADLAGSGEIAARHWEMAGRLLSGGDGQDRAVAAAMDSKPGTARETAAVLESRIEPSRKVVILTALARHDPATFGACAGLARTLNFDRRFPHLLLRDALAALPGGDKP